MSLITLCVAFMIESCLSIEEFHNRSRCSAVNLLLLAKNSIILVRRFVNSMWGLSTNTNYSKLFSSIQSHISSSFRCLYCLNLEKLSKTSSLTFSFISFIPLIRFSRKLEFKNFRAKFNIVISIVLGSISLFSKSLILLKILLTVSNFRNFISPSEIFTILFNVAWLS
mmetsp:Transcript_31681/g.5736  ORF Transcript_31681/g.5736 Transcript_31681/m.5736 type:complete len:168 (-) Transcript_31681:859-1362(-)